MIPSLVQKRWRRRTAIPYHQVGLSCSLAVVLLLLGAVSAGIAGYIDLVQDLPSLEQLEQDLDPVNGRMYKPTRLLDRTGQHEILVLQNPASSGWQVLTLDPSQSNHLPSTLIKATLAALDPTFWQNPGYQWTGLTEDVHPTLAQRLVYELLLNKEPVGLRRNLRERLLAAQLIYKYGHEQVLEWYLNTVQYGTYIYGADAAGRAFFGRPASQLTIAQAAYLVALTEQPQVNPWDAPPEVWERQREIIQSMLGQGWITAEEASEASKIYLDFQTERPIQDLSPHFSKLVLDQLANQFPEENLARGGWIITTTLDYELQLQAECAATAQLARVQGEAASASCTAAQLLPTLPADQSGSTKDLAVAVIILDPKQGQVLAVVGDPFALRPAGTIITPVIYLSAFTRGFGPASLIWDIPEATLAEAQPPGTLEAQVYQGPMRLRTALVNDYLQPTVTLSKQLGWDVIQATASQLGLTSSELQAIEGSDRQVLGVNTTLMEIARVAGIFSNQGVLPGQENPQAGASNAGLRLISPAAVIRLQDADQVIWLDWSKPENQPVISPQIAYIMNHILSDEPARWPSLGHPNPLEIGRPAGAKTGTTLDGQNIWAVGYTPQSVIGVWVGKSSPTSTGIPVAIPAGIWHALIQFASQKKPVEDWGNPPGISFIDICDPSGLIPTPDCPTVITEVFLPGSEPTQLDYLYRTFQINRETGRLATVFTPPELIEERVYLVPPLEAQAWAQEAGLPKPPDEYDVIYSAPTSQNAQIIAPEMFTHVSGTVEFHGSATGPGFEYFRLQVGQGLNPQTWTQIGEDISEPVRDGLLGTWDTRQLSGLYAVQLLVVGQNQRVERAVMQVTVDNQVPEVVITSPQSEQEVSLSKPIALALQADVTDNMEIERVEFYLDKQILATLFEPPYWVSWQPLQGEHTLMVRAYDLAGNESETAVLFRVK